MTEAPAEWLADGVSDPESRCAAMVGGRVTRAWGGAVAGGYG